MEASVATDSEYGVQYKFICTAGGGNDSIWQAGTSYEDTGLLPETEYTYTVTARDTSGNHNETAPSTAESATTDMDLVPPTPDPMTWMVAPEPDTGGGLLVYEPFDYAIGPIKGLTVGAETGLTGTWDASYTDSRARVSGWSLSYSAVPVTGGCFTGSLHADAWSEAALHPLALSGFLGDGDELWFSFLADTIATVPENHTRLQIGADSDNHIGLYMGNTSSSAAQVKAIIKVGGSESLSSGSASFTDAAGRLVVGRVIFGATDTVEVYLPGPDLALPSVAGTVTGSLDQSTFDMVRIAYTHGNTLNSDEIRIGTTYEDVIVQETTGGGGSPYDSIRMAAAIATDPSGVEYYFDCISGPGNDSGWQGSASYIDTPLNSGMQYTYTVTARDKSPAQNTTAASPGASATTKLRDFPPSFVDAGENMTILSGRTVKLDPNVVDDGLSDLTYLWSANPDFGVVFDPNANIANPDVTITKPVGPIPITIENAGFEDSVLTDGNYNSSHPSWSGINGGGGTWNPDATGAVFYGYGGNAPEGQNVGYVGGDSGLAQVLTGTLTAETTYTLTVEVGNNDYYYYSFAGYKVQLVAGGTILAEDDSSVAIAVDTFETSTVTFDSTGVDAGLLGQNLEIRLLANGSGEIDFDDVQLLADSSTSTAPYTVTLTLAVRDDGNLSSPVEDTMKIYVYDFTQLDPVELLDILACDIIDLDLHRGIENSLLAKIDAAIAKLEDGNPKNDRAAVRMLRAFMRAVRAQKGKKISEEDADDLIAFARQIIDMLRSE
jgi:hypothetical protein